MVNNHKRMQKNIILKSKSLFCAILLIPALSLAWIAFLGCGKTNQEPMLRFHIRANSDTAADQEIKLTVRDAVLDFLEPLLEPASCAASALDVIRSKKPQIQTVAKNTLTQNGFFYGAEVWVGEKHFPARMYGGTVISSGYFKAVIISLGEAEGKNWWCVLYPPLCYLEARGPGNFRYRSKILELLRRHFNR